MRMIIIGALCYIACGISAAVPAPEPNARLVAAEPVQGGSLDAATGAVGIITVQRTPTPASASTATASPAGATATSAKEQVRDPRELYSRANRLYESGDYEGARAEYERLLSIGYAGSNLYYNLGNACCKLDQKGPAILYYMKALRLRPRDQDIKSNLEYALSLVEDRIEPAPKAWAVRRWAAMVGHFTSPELRRAAVAIYWALCLIFIMAIYFRPM
ncbi:MAG: tetratricopeptide repeat protein, partial [Candidatus Aureabacteria bacterium]|nr:tetratricopeptide repeat protein [Candidatus Auribacterota bacterium]